MIKKIEIKTFGIILIPLCAICLYVLTGLSAKHTPSEGYSLLDRPEKIRYGKEWDQVQNKYATLRSNLNMNPGDYKSLLSLAQLFIQEAKVTGQHPLYYRQALDVIDKLIHLKPHNAIMCLALQTKADIQLSQHHFREALATGQAAKKISKAPSSQLYGIMTDACVELGLYQQAVGYADQMVQIRPDLKSYARVSYLREIHGDIEGARKAMAMAVQAGAPGTDETAWAQLQYGMLLKRYINADQALQVFTSILKTRPNYPFALSAIADEYADLGQYTMAEDFYKKAIGIIPEVHFYVGLAKVFQKTGNDKQLQRTKNKIIDMISEDEESGHNMNLELTQIYMHLFDDFPTAFQMIKKELNQRPDNIDVNRIAALLYAKQCHTQKANHFFQKATQTQSKHPQLNIISNLIKSC